MSSEINSPELNHVADALSFGSVLFQGQYTIQNVISSGGFGITYAALDHANREVVIKECFPGSHCRRNKSRVQPRVSGGRAEMDKIIHFFLREARSLSSLLHPNIVRVHQVFQENDTAYMALDRIQGNDLLHLIQTGGRQGKPDWVVALTLKLVSALAYVHDNDILHRDISPDNIFISTLDEPVLIDFGAASWISDGNERGQSHIAVVKDGYSPHEFYYSGGNVGTWSDIYSMAATLFHVITGQAPVDSQRRLGARVERSDDPLPALAGNVHGYPKGFLETIDKALRLLPTERYPTAESWMEDLKPFKCHEETKVKFLDKALSMKRSMRSGKEAQTPAPPKNFAQEQSTQTEKEHNLSLDITGLNEIAGFIGGCLVDSETGMMMAAVGGGKLDLEAASAANTEVVRSKNSAIKLLGLNDAIEDILISLGKQYHLIRPLEHAPSVFLYVALDRKSANLGLARVQVKKVEQSLSI